MYKFGSLGFVLGLGGVLLAAACDGDVSTSFLQSSPGHGRRTMALASQAPSCGPDLLGPQGGGTPASTTCTGPWEYKVFDTEVLVEQERQETGHLASTGLFAECPQPRCEAWVVPGGPLDELETKITARNEVLSVVERQVIPEARVDSMRTRYSDCTADYAGLCEGYVGTFGSSTSWWNNGLGVPTASMGHDGGSDSFAELCTRHCRRTVQKLCRQECLLQVKYRKRAPHWRLGYSSAGLSRSGLDSYAEARNRDAPDKYVSLTDATCTTCEHISLDPLEPTTAQVDNTFDCLYERLQHIPEGVADYDGLRTALVHRLKIFFEIYGHLLDGGRDDAPRRDNALQVYQNYPTVAPPCGIEAEHTGECTQLAQMKWRLHYCARLSGAHVSPALIEHTYGVCVDLLQAIADAPQQCDLSSDTEEARRIHLQLLFNVLEPPSSSPTSMSIAQMARKLKLINDWYHARELVERGLDKEELYNELSVVTSKFWFLASASYDNYAALKRQLTSAQALLDDDDESNDSVAYERVKESLQQTIETSFQVDQAVIQAAFFEAPDGSRPLFGAPLALMVGQGLSPLVERLESISAYHDFACAFEGCLESPPQTPLSQQWAILAHLASEGPTDPPIALPPGYLPGWSDALSIVLENRRDLRPAFEDTTSPPIDITYPYERLAQLLTLAAQREENYRLTGRFRSSLGKMLYTLVHSDQRVAIEHYVGDRLVDLGEAQELLNRQRIVFLHNLVNEQEAALKTEQVLHQIERIREEITDLEVTRDGYIAAAIEADLLADLPRSMEEAERTAGNSVEYQDLERRIGYVERRLASMTTKREITSWEIAEIKIDAMQDIIMDQGAIVADIPIRNYPDHLGMLLKAFLIKATRELERQIRIQNISREIDLLGTHLASIQRELSMSNLRDHSLEVLVKASLVNLDGRHLYLGSSQLAHAVVDYLHPISALWYPEAIDTIRSDYAEELQILMNAMPDAPMEHFVRSMRVVTNALMTKHSFYASVDANPRTAPQVVALGFPRPDLTPQQSAQLPRFRTIDPGRSAEFWERVDSGEVIEFKIVPEDIYASGGAAYLPCSKELPLIRHMGFILVHESGLDELNGYLSKDGLGGQQQMFATNLGPQYYLQMNQKWRKITTPLFYIGADAPTGEAMLMFETAPASRKGDALGMSPFTAFEFRLQGSPLDEYTQFGLADAWELLVIMELERVQAQQTMSWVSTCTDAP